MRKRLGPSGRGRAAGRRGRNQSGPPAGGRTADESDGPMTRTFQRDDSPAAPSLPLITFSDFCCSSVSARRPRPVSGRRTVYPARDGESGSSQNEQKTAIDFSGGCRLTNGLKISDLLEGGRKTLHRRLNMQMFDFLISSSARQTSQGNANSFSFRGKKKKNPAVRSRSALQTRRLLVSI